LHSGVSVSEGARREHRFRCKNGDWVWLQGNPTAIRDENGLPREFLSVVRDVTEQRHQEVALAEAKVAAEAATAAKSEFLANMSHELRTPLTSIIGFSQLLKAQPELSAQSARFVDSVTQASQALLSIVNDVLDFSKLEAGQIEIRREPGSTHAIATDAIQLFGPQAEEKGIALNLELDSLPDKALIDTARLRQILLNLVGNAVKFTETGSVTLKAGFADGHLQFEVRDTGPGIPHDQFDKLFKRFSQVDGTSRRSHGGTGLGLAICKGLAEAMGGSIDARSRHGEGSTFSVRIPADVVESPAATSEKNPTLTSFEGLRILVADDNKANRMLIAAMLEPVGVQLALASTGREALELATARPFDVILMDLHMPEMDGYDATRTIRSGTGPSSATPVLAFTADSELRTESGHASVKFQGIVCKPVMQKALLDAIAGAVGLSADAYPVEKARAARTA
jgi:signal transduction histidine kinase/CheY-like chemotaxis protein